LLPHLRAARFCNASTFPRGARKQYQHFADKRDVSISSAGSVSESPRNSTRISLGHPSDSAVSAASGPQARQTYEQDRTAFSRGAWRNYIRLDRYVVRRIHSPLRI